MNCTFPSRVVSAIALAGVLAIGLLVTACSSGVSNSSAVEFEEVRAKT